MSADAVPETRRATCVYDLDGRTGEGTAEITDDGVSVGGAHVAFLDADTLTDEERVVTLGVWPAGALRLSRLARRHDTFVGALRAARDRARVAGLLAHGVTAPLVFAGGLREPECAASLLVYRTHLTVVPADRDPFQVPFGRIRAIRFGAGEWTVAVETEDGVSTFGRLARQTDAFARELTNAWEAQGKRLAAVAGDPRFADGLAIAGFDALVEPWTAPERDACAATIRRHAGEIRVGLVELLDPDGEALAPKRPMPENLAAFLLARVEEKVVLELLSGPSAATYVFRGTLDDVNRDLQRLHFRRRPLSFSENELAGEAARPYRLALRRLEPLQRLRAALAGRVVHGEGWEKGLTALVG